MATETILIGRRKVLTLKELLRPGLKAIFVGINPSLVSVKCGHYYQGTLGKRLWKRLEEYRITGPLPRGREDDAAFGLGFGFADLVRRPTSSAKELGNAELKSGAADLIQRLKATQDMPLVVFVYATAAESASEPLHEQGYQTFRMPGPYAQKDIERSKMTKLSTKMRAAN